MRTFTYFISAEMPAERFAELTGLTPHRGFIVNRAHCEALHPMPRADEISTALTSAGIAHSIVRADTYNQGRKRVERVA